MVRRKEYLAVLPYDYALRAWATTAWRWMDVLLPIACGFGW
jgi:hypothetical protein